MNAITNIELSSVAISEVDVLGALLAQIADLTAEADKIKDAIKDSASKGGAKVVQGALFKATYIESNVTTFDKEAFIKEHGSDVYAKYTKTGARFSVKVTSK